MNYKFSLHIRAEAPNKKLACIHIEIAQLVGCIVESDLWADEETDLSQKSVSIDSCIM